MRQSVHQSTHNAIMDCDDGDFAKQLMREKLRHERGAYDSQPFGHSERWMGPPWGRGRAGFSHEYPGTMRFPGGRMEGPVAKKFRGEWVEFPNMIIPPGISPRGAWHPYPRQDFHHQQPYYHRYSSSVGSHSQLSSNSSSSSMTGTLSKSGTNNNSSSSSNNDSLKKVKEETLIKSLGEFFVQHKNEEWFKHKYHPLEFPRRIAERRAMVKDRKQVFEKLMKLNLLGKVSLEVGRVKDIVKVLDAAVILMEGGTESDLKVLDQEEESVGQVMEIKSKCSVDKKKLPAKFTEPLKLERNPSNVTTTVAENDGNVTDSGSISDSEDETVANKKLPPYPCTSLEEESSDKEEKEEGSERRSKEEEGDKLKPLHKTVSLFLRNLPVDITKAEIEDLCKSYPGFLRVALQDPQPENKFLRRAWVTFEPWVNVKDICWNMSSLKIRDCELKPTVNSELKQRVRAINGLACHKAIAKQDIKHIVKVVQNLDNLHGVWNEDDDEEEDNACGDGAGRRKAVGGEDDDVNPEDQKEIFGFVSKNPLLKNITDFLVDEGSYEEEALLDKSGSCWDDYDDRPKPAHAEVFIEKDAELLKALDRMILYLRVVYSLDYYVAADYQDEDDMPHKCGIIHVRASKPTHKVTQNDVNEWMNSFESKISEFTVGKFWMTDEEMLRVGKKEETEIEKFIQANTQEISKDKWLCPLSGKKFKGHDFVRKHIRTKHSDKLEQVKVEVEFFNNYAKDCRRPSDISASPSVNQPSSSSSSQGSGNSSSTNSSPRFVHHYPVVRRPVPPMYRSPYSDIRAPGEVFRPRDFVPRRARLPRSFVTRMVNPNGHM